MRGPLVTLLLLASLLCPLPGSAGGVLYSLVMVQSGAVSAAEAARQAKEQYGGKVLSTRLVEPPDQPAYFRVKLISQGTVRVVRIDRQR